MNEDVLLGVISGLWLIVAGAGGYAIRRIHEKLDTLVVHQTGCLRSFADKKSNADDHREFFRRTDDHERRLIRLESGMDQKRCMKE
mgnify:CR=1 FL=1